MERNQTQGFRVNTPTNSNRFTTSRFAIVFAGFRFNNPKQLSNWINLVSFCSSRRAIENAVFVF